VAITQFASEYLEAISWQYVHALSAAAWRVTLVY
jgi:hypothetical protein